MLSSWLQSEKFFDEVISLGAKPSVMLGFTEFRENRFISTSKEIHKLAIADSDACVGHLLLHFVKHKGPVLSRTVGTS